MEREMILGTGIDIVAVDRIRAVLERQKMRFMERVFTPKEQSYCNAYRDPAPHYAVRFAAKEAFLKALGTGWSGGIRWVDVEVRREEGKAPVIQIHGEAAQVAARMQVRIVHVSLSHSSENAVATVILEG
jgi:holo-[acyl-carrier protein] synthase